MRLKRNPLISSIHGRICASKGTYKIQTKKHQALAVWQPKDVYVPVYDHPTWEWMQNASIYLDTWYHEITPANLAHWLQQAKWSKPTPRSALDYFKAVNIHRLAVGMAGLLCPPYRAYSIIRRLFRSDEWPDIPDGKTWPVWLSGKEKDETPFDEETGEIPPLPDPPYPPSEPAPPEPQDCPPGSACADCGNTYIHNGYHMNPWGDCLTLANEKTLTRTGPGSCTWFWTNGWVRVTLECTVGQMWVLRANSPFVGLGYWTSLNYNNCPPHSTWYDWSSGFCTPRPPEESCLITMGG